MNSPACNTGVHPPSEGRETAPLFHFDWYRATVPTSVESLTQHCLDIAGPYPQLLQGKGRFNYHHSRTIEQAGDRVATILYGGSNGHPNVEASGYRAANLAKMLREGGPHRVTRCDIARDVYGVGLFEELDAMASSLARQYGIKSRRITNDDPADGDTRYIGSRASAVFVRIYEKGKADRLQHGELEPEVLEPWVRVELEVKPQKEMREVAARLEPAQFWGVSAWTQQLAKEAFNMGAAPIPFHPRRTASDDRAFATMCTQYRNLLQRRLKTVHGGDQDALAREILARVFDDREAAA